MMTVTFIFPTGQILGKLCTSCSSLCSKLFHSVGASKKPNYIEFCKDKLHVVFTHMVFTLEVFACEFTATIQLYPVNVFHKLTLGNNYKFPFYDQADRSREGGVPLWPD